MERWRGFNEFDKQQGIVEFFSLGFSRISKKQHRIKDTFSDETSKGQREF
jgi:hypothetical protein